MRNARAPTSTRSIGFCVIWVCNSSSSSSKFWQLVLFAPGICHFLPNSQLINGESPCENRSAKCQITHRSHRGWCGSTSISTLPSSAHEHTAAGALLHSGRHMTGLSALTPQNVNSGLRRGGKNLARRRFRDRRVREQGLPRAGSNEGDQEFTGCGLGRGCGNA